MRELTVTMINSQAEINHHENVVFLHVSHVFTIKHTTYLLIKWPEWEPFHVHLKTALKV